VQFVHVKCRVSGTGHIRLRLRHKKHTGGNWINRDPAAVADITSGNVKGTGIRQNCHCIPSRDIGAYNSCLSECKYCYANRKPEIPKNVIKLHYEKSPLLLGHLKENDNLIDTEVIRYIEPKQSTLFDF